MRNVDFSIIQGFEEGYRFAAARLEQDLAREGNSGTNIAEFWRSLVGQITPSALQPAEPIMRYDYGSAGFGNSGEDATDFPLSGTSPKPA